jgi:hypothetical protein
MSSRNEPAEAVPERRGCHARRPLANDRHLSFLHFGQNVCGYWIYPTFAVKIRLLPFALGSLILAAAFAGCSSTAAQKRKPTVAITISVQPGSRPSAEDLAELHTLLQPEIERRGYVMAKSSRTTDYFVNVRYPIDPIALQNLRFERAQPTVPFLKGTEWQPDASGNREEYKRAIAEMIKEPN